LPYFFSIKKLESFFYEFKYKYLKVSLLKKQFLNIFPHPIGIFSYKVFFALIMLKTIRHAELVGASLHFVFSIS